jgi:hypothetical protein
VSPRGIVVKFPVNQLVAREVWSDEAVTAAPEASHLYVARSPVVRAVPAIAGTPLVSPVHSDLCIDLRCIQWHAAQVLNVGEHAA